SPVCRFKHIDDLEGEEFWEAQGEDVRNPVANTGLPVEAGYAQVESARPLPEVLEGPESDVFFRVVDDRGHRESPENREPDAMEKAANVGDCDEDPDRLEREGLREEFLRVVYVFQDLHHRNAVEISGYLLPQRTAGVDCLATHATLASLLHGHPGNVQAQVLAVWPGGSQVRAERAIPAADVQDARRRRQEFRDLPVAIQQAWRAPFSLALLPVVVIV